jgi:hypothetical protein
VKKEEEEAFAPGEEVLEEGGHRLNPKCQSSNFKFLKGGLPEGEYNDQRKM